MKTEMDFAIFFSGALMATLFFIGVHFYRFWKQTRDPFFARFAAAFFLLSFERIPLLFYSPSVEARGYVLVFRIVAFVLIIYAVIQKNRKPVQP